MKFKQDANLYREHFIGVIIILVFFVVINFVLKSKVAFWVCLPSFLIGCMCSYLPCEEMIEISEEGISCDKKGTLLWEIKWKEIVELKKSVRCNHPSIEIITYNRFGEPEQVDKNNHYFLWNKKSKEALKKYYSGTITKRTYWKNKKKTGDGSLSLDES